MLPRGVRNRNPGNIIKSGINWTGKLKETLGEDKFEVFDTFEHGVQALGELLLRYQRGPRQIKDIAGAIATWAPPSENNTAAYIAKVARDLKVQPDTPLDFSDPPTLRALAVAIGEMECGPAEFHEAYTDTIIDTGIAAALAMRPQDVRVTPSPQVVTKEPAMAAPALNFPGIFSTLLKIAVPQAAPILVLADQIVGALAPLAQDKIAAEVNRHTDNPEIGVKIANAVIQSAKDQSGIEDPMKAASAVLDDPGIAAKVQQDVVNDLERMKPILDAMHRMSLEQQAADDTSMDRAAARSPSTWDMTKTLVVWIMGMGSVIVLFVCGVALAQVIIYPGHAPTTEVWAALTGILGTVFGLIGGVFAYRFAVQRQQQNEALRYADELLRKRLVAATA